MAFIRAAQGSSGPSPTRITPGNSNPPYLVEEEVYVMNGNGRAIGSLTSITPSDSSPVILSPNNIYKPDVSGYAVGSVTSITPSNSTPASLSTSYVYKPSESGYAIKSYQSITPSASGAAFNAGMVKMSAGGYACTSPPSGGASQSKWYYTTSPAVNVTVPKSGSSTIDVGNWAGVSSPWKLVECIFRTRWGNNYYCILNKDLKNQTVSYMRLNTNVPAAWGFSTTFSFGGDRSFVCNNGDSGNTCQISLISAVFVQ